MPINPLVIKIAVAIALLVGAFFMGYRLASNLVHGQWDKEKLQTMQMVASANQRVLDAEHAANQRVASITQKYETKLGELRNEQNRLIALNADGQLYINAICPNSSAVANASAATSFRDGSQRVRLSEPDGRFLIQFAADADQVANQLTQCQGVINSDRELR